MKREFYADQYFAIEPIAGFSPFMGHWPSKNASHDYGIKCQFDSLAIPIVLCTVRTRILCWSTFAIEYIADFCPFWGYWTSKNGPRNHVVKRNLLLMQNLWYLIPLGRWFHFGYFYQNNQWLNYNTKTFQRKII